MRLSPHATQTCPTLILYHPQPLSRSFSHAPSRLFSTPPPTRRIPSVTQPSLPYRHQHTLLRHPSHSLRRPRITTAQDVPSVHSLLLSQHNRTLIQRNLLLSRYMRIKFSRSVSNALLRRHVKMSAHAGPGKY